MRVEFAHRGLHTNFMIARGNETPRFALLGERGNGNMKYNFFLNGNRPPVPVTMQNKNAVKIKTWSESEIVDKIKFAGNMYL